MNRKLAASFGFDRLYDVCGQTYPRKLDSRILNVLSSIAQSCCRFDAADDGRGDGVDKRVKLGGEAQNDGVDGREADDAGIVDLGEGENAGIFTIHH